MKISVKRFWGIHLPVLAAIIIYLTLQMKCPIKYYFHIDCPTCGMTRAMFALFRGDFAAYIHFNPMALPFLLILLLRDLGYRLANTASRYRRARQVWHKPRE